MKIAIMMTNTASVPSGCAIAIGEAAERALRRALDRTSARVDGFQGRGHHAASALWPGAAGISTPCGWASFSM